MSKKKSITPAKTDPRYSYRTPKAEKEQVEKQIEALVAKINKKNGKEYYKVNKNTVFLEAVYRGLEYLERADLTPQHDEGYFQIRFVKRNKLCKSCKTVAVSPDRKCQNCKKKYTPLEYNSLKISK